MTGSRVLVCPVLVARDELLDLASRRIEEVAGGTGRFLILAGEAGLGKSRLLGAIRRRAAASGKPTFTQRRQCGGEHHPVTMRYHHYPPWRSRIRLVLYPAPRVSIARAN